MSDGLGVEPAPRPSAPRPPTPTPAPAKAPAPQPAPAVTPAAATGRPAGPAGPGPAGLGNAAAARAEPLPSGSISLAAEPFTVPAETAAAIADKPQLVHVHLGGYARGEILIARDRKGYKTPKSQFIRLVHPALEPLRAVGVEPKLKVVIDDSKIIKGEASLGEDSDTLLEAIKEHQQALGWAGIDLGRLPKPDNKLVDGRLRFVLPKIPFSIGKLLGGTIAFGIDGDTVVFEGQATIVVAGQKGEVQVARDERGGLSITGDLAVQFGAIAATLHACLDSAGNFDVRGTASYQGEKFSGEITVVVADAKVADTLAREQVGLEAVEQQPAAPGGEGADKAARSRLTNPVPVGWGTLNFAVSEWLAGTAKVVISPKGHLTVLGEIAPPAEVELFKQRDYVQHLFKLEARATYGVPVVGNVFVFANIGLDALAKLGPGKLHQIKLDGKYSTDPEVARSFTVSGTLTISAFAGLRMRAEGGAGVEIFDHDIKVGVGLDALAGVRGYVEATPSIGMREVGDPTARKTQFFIKGHLELAAQPFLGLSGDLFVELDSPWWSPAPDKKWTWPIGSLEYPLPGEFGIGADLDYVLGSPDLPEIKFGRPAFDSSKFITDLVNDHVPPKRAGEQEKPGTWKEGAEGQGEAPSGPPGAESAPVPSAPTAPTGLGGKDESGHPAPKTATPGTQTTGYPPQEGHEGVPAQTAAQRREQGMKALGGLASRSKRDPYTREELKSALEELKDRYGFTRLEVEETRQGDEIMVVAEMSPATKQPVKVEPFDVVPYRPTTPGVENHHGVLDVWATNNVPGYKSRASDSPTVALTPTQHAATKQVYRQWLKERTGKEVGGKVNWSEVSPREVKELSERMFDAAGVPEEARERYYAEVNRYIYS
jgi:HNH/Endo VII superfamily toxin with a SHH signature